MLNHICKTCGVNPLRTELRPGSCINSEATAQMIAALQGPYCDDCGYNRHGNKWPHSYKWSEREPHEKIWREVFRRWGHAAA